MSAPDRRIAVVVPVFDMAVQVERCVASLVPQLDPGDEIVVVDDGSRDDGPALAAAAGALVIGNENGKGPYRARNHGAAATVAPLLLFVDARCRALPGLLDAHRDLLTRDGVALSCTDVGVVETPNLAGRISRVMDPFRVRHKVRGTPMDFFPTANLGTTREAFEALGGFRAIRSGADADFCWRVQRSGHGTILGDARELMVWEPRDRLVALVEQYYRYGRSNVYLDRLHAMSLAEAAGDPTRDTSRLVHLDEAAPSAYRADRVADLGANALHLVLRVGRVRGRREHRDVLPDDGLQEPSLGNR